MGFYLRKSLKVGPLRFNLSRSGIGVSGGVRGFRLGTNARGNYIHMGRSGFYYRSTLSSHGASRSRLPSPIRTPRLIPAAEELTEIDSGSVLDMCDSSSADLLDEIRLKQRRMRLWPLVAVAGALFLLSLTLVVPIWILGLGLVAIVGLTMWIASRDEIRKSVVLFYELDDQMEAAYQGIHNGFDWLASCNRVWHLEAQGQTHDWKRSAGATSLVQRRPVSLHKTTPSFLKTNIAVPAIPVGRQTMYFFPDRILVFEGASVGAISYDDLRVEVSTTKFIEEGPVPQDAQVVEHRWKYINKKGGPDRRFKDNRELPVTLYGELYLRSESGLNEALQTSKLDAPRYFHDGAAVLAKAISQGRSASGAPNAAS